MKRGPASKYVDPDVAPPSPALLERHRAAMSFLQLGQIEVDGRTIVAPDGIDMLAAVVWPESEMLGA